MRACVRACVVGIPTEWPIDRPADQPTVDRPNVERLVADVPFVCASVGNVERGCADVTSVVPPCSPHPRWQRGKRVE